MMTALCFVLALAGADSSSRADELAQRAHQAEVALEHDEAARLWLEVLALEDLPVHRRKEAHIQLASAFIILGDKEGARAHFRRVLEDNEFADLAPDAPAKFHVLFEDVRSEIRAERKANQDGTWLAGAVTLTGGVASGLGAATLYVLSAVAQGEAVDIDVQVKRAAVYDRRDAFLLGGHIAAAGSLALCAVAGGVALLTMATNGATSE